MGALISCVALNLCECAFCMACGCCTGIFNATLSQMARFGHLVVYILIFVLSIVMGRHFQQNIVAESSYTYYVVDVSDSLNIASLYDGCNKDYYEECVFRQLIYRASCALTVFFGVMMILTSCSDYLNRSMWTLKLIVSTGLFVAFWWGTNEFFSGWAELCRWISFIWLLIQGLLMLDIGFDMHDIILTVAGNSEDWAAPIAKTGYIVMALGFLACAIAAFVELFDNFSGCDTGHAFAIITVIVTVVQAVISMLDIVNRGILTPCFMMAYAAFMCWYALLSSPEEGCNASADANNTAEKNSSVIIVSIISLCTLMFCVINGSLLMQIFMPNGQGVLETNYGTSSNNNASIPLKNDGSLDGVLTGERDASAPPGAPHQQPGQQQGQDQSPYMTSYPPDASGGPRERMFFHALMMVASCYGAMVLTNWGKTDGSPEGVDEDEQYAGSSSMWLKIISQWVFLAIYFKALHASYLNEQSGSS